LQQRVRTRNMYMWKPSPAYAKFEEKRVCEGIALFLQLQPIFSITLLAFAALQWASGFEVDVTWTVVMPLSVFFSAAGFKTKLQETTSAWPRVYGSFFHCILFVAILASRVSAAISVGVNSGILQHRVFLTTVVPTFEAAATVLLVPDIVYWFFFCPFYLAAWGLFHYLAESLDFVSMWLGVNTLLSAVVLRQAAQIIAWQKFSLATELEQSMHDAKMAHAEVAQMVEMQGIMLSTLFDASCECDFQGHICDADMKINALFAGGADLRQTKLADHAADSSEKKRLEAYLRTAASSPKPQGHMIEVKFRSMSSQGQSDFNAKVYCVKRAVRPEESGKTDQRFFVGVQVMQLVSSSETLATTHVASTDVSSGGSAASHVHSNPGVKFQTFRDAFGAETRNDDIELILDPGEPNLLLTSGSPVFEFDVCTDECIGLLDLVPNKLKKAIDDWVYSEVSSDRTGHSELVLQSLEMKVPARSMRTLVAEHAWLELPEDDMRVKLRMCGVRWVKHRRSAFRFCRDSSSSDEDNPDATFVKDSGPEGAGRDGGESSTIQPWDSVSNDNRFRQRQAVASLKRMATKTDSELMREGAWGSSRSCQY